MWTTDGVAHSPVEPRSLRLLQVEDVHVGGRLRHPARERRPDEFPARVRERPQA